MLRNPAAESKTVSGSRMTSWAVSLRAAATGVHRQIEKDLLKLAGVRLDAAQFRSKQGLHLDVLTNDAPQHSLQVGHYLIETENARHRHLLAAESKELSGQSGGPLSGLG